MQPLSININEKKDQEEIESNNNNLLASVLGGLANSLSVVANSVTTRTPADMQRILLQLAQGGPTPLSPSSSLSSPTSAGFDLSSPILGGAGGSSFHFAMNESARSVTSRQNSMHHHHQHHQQHHHGRQLSASEQESLSAFVSDMTWRCVEGRDSAGLPQFKPWRGNCAVLFVDLSGYSKIASALSSGGGGAHALATAVNSYFSTILEVVKTAGGDVLTFCGDAAICIFCDAFRTSSGDRRSCLRAVRTAHALQKQCGAFAISGHDMQFRMHIAVSFGCVDADVIPSLHSRGQRAFSFVQGQPLAETKLVDYAKAGETCVSALVKCHTDDVINYTTELPNGRGQLPDGAFLLESVDEEECAVALETGSDIENDDGDDGDDGGDDDDFAYDEGSDGLSDEEESIESARSSLIGTPVEESLGQPTAAAAAASGAGSGEQQTSSKRPRRYPRQLPRRPRPRDPETEALFVPPVVVKRMRNGVPLSQQSELRSLSVLFISKHKDVKTSTKDWFFEIQQELERHGAQPLQCLSDDKGVTVTACINLSTSEQQPADMAITVGAALLERQCVSVGIASGADVLAGVVGSPVARRSEVTGDPVVRAARLCQHAVKSGIPLVTDGSISEQLTDKSRLIQVDRIDIKGSPAPVAIYTLSRARSSYLGVLTDAAPHVYSTEVHREVQDKLLDEYINNARAGQVSVAVVSGMVLCGKKAACINALSRAEKERVVFKHMCSANDAPLAIAGSWADYFRFCRDPEIAQLAVELEEQLGMKRMSRSMTILVEMTTLLIRRGHHIGCIVTSSEKVDESSLSFIRELLKQPIIYPEALVDAGADSSSHHHQQQQQQQQQPAAPSASGTFRRGRRSVKAAPAQGRITFFLTHTALYGSLTADDLSSTLLRGVTANRDRPFIPKCGVVLVPCEADCRSIFRAVAGFGCDSQLRVALAHLSGSAPSFVAAISAHAARTASTFLVAGASSSSSPINLMSPGYSKLEQAGAKAFVDGIEQSDGSQIMDAPGRLVWRHIAPRLYSRCVYVFDVLPPRLQLIMRVLAALTFRAECGRVVQGIPVPVLLGTIRKLHGGGGVSVSHAASSSSSSSSSVDKNLLRDLEKLSSLYLVMVETAPLLAPDPCVRARLPPLLEAVFSLLPPDTLALYNRRGAAVADAYFAEPHGQSQSQSPHAVSNSSFSSRPMHRAPSAVTLAPDGTSGQQQQQRPVSKALQHLRLAQLFLRAGQKEKALECVRDGWSAALEERDGGSPQEEWAVLSYRYSVYAKLLLPAQKSSTADLIRFFFPIRPLGSSSNVMAEQHHQEANLQSSTSFAAGEAYDPEREKDLPSSREYDLFWRARREEKRGLGLLSPVGLQATRWIAPLALGSVGGALTLAARQGAAALCQVAASRGGEGLHIHRFPTLSLPADLNWLANAVRILDESVPLQAGPKRQHPLLPSFSSSDAAPNNNVSAQQQDEQEQQRKKLAMFQQQQIQSRELKHIEEVLLCEGKTESEIEAALATFLQDCRALEERLVQRLRAFVVSPECERISVSLWRSALLKQGPERHDADIVFRAMRPFFSRKTQRQIDQINNSSGVGGGVPAASATAAEGTTTTTTAAEEVAHLDDDDRSSNSSSEMYEASEEFEAFEKSLMVLAHSGFEVPFPGMSLRLIRDSVICDTRPDLIDYRSCLFSLLVVRVKLGAFKKNSLATDLRLLEEEARRRSAEEQAKAAEATAAAGDVDKNNNSSNSRSVSFKNPAPPLAGSPRRHN